MLPNTTSRQQQTSKNTILTYKRDCCHCHRWVFCRSKRALPTLSGQAGSNSPPRSAPNPGCILKSTKNHTLQCLLQVLCPEISTYGCLATDELWVPPWSLEELGMQFERILSKDERILAKGNIYIYLFGVNLNFTYEVARINNTCF